MWRPKRPAFLGHFPPLFWANIDVQSTVYGMRYASRLQQAFAGMILVIIHPPDVAQDRFRVGVARDFHQLVEIRVGLGGRGKEAGPQTVPRVIGGIEAAGRRTALDDVGDAAIV